MAEYYVYENWTIDRDGKLLLGAAALLCSGRRGFHVKDPTGPREVNYVRKGITSGATVSGAKR